MNEVSWAEVVGSVGVPLLIAAGLFAALVIVALILTHKSRRRLTDRNPSHTR